ncbi:MAG: DUF2281 domain-containing protein [Bacteroidales bacterium]|nr:DUF2281 domain-containing protein [Bacteroidales bacterium]MCF8454320.1 DUF2281 domain-containing protein [Bacteroidales bacterium]
MLKRELTQRARYKDHLDLAELPKHVQIELIDYYDFLIEKYASERKKKGRKEHFFDLVSQHKFSLPTNYKFDREAANER